MLFFHIVLSIAELDTDVVELVYDYVSYETHLIIAWLIAVVLELWAWPSIDYVENYFKPDTGLKIIL